MMIKARAPLRIGMAGGGTDLSPFAEVHGGAVLSAAINKYVYATVVPRSDGQLSFRAADVDESWTGPCGELPGHDMLRLHAGVHERMAGEAGRRTPLSVTVTTYSEVPVGSGLGASSALVVCLVRAYAKLLGARLSPSAVARLSHQIERADLALPGGRQDHYAAAFGGVNLMEFAGDSVEVRRVRMTGPAVAELESTLLLFNTGISRDSGQISREQSVTMAQPGSSAFAPYLGMKREAFAMRDSLVRGRLDEVASSLRRGWELKTRTSARVANPAVRAVIEAALGEGAMAAKACGSGGGGHILLLADVRRRPAVQRRIAAEFAGTISTCGVELKGAGAWKC